MQNIIGQWLLSLKHYVLMCLLLSSPERLPYSAYSIALTVFSYLLIGMLLVDEDIHTVDERPADTSLVAGNQARRARASPERVAVKATGACVQNVID